MGALPQSLREADVVSKPRGVSQSWKSLATILLTAVHPTGVFNTVGSACSGVQLHSKRRQSSSRWERIVAHAGNTNAAQENFSSAQDPCVHRQHEMMSTLNRNFARCTRGEVLLGLFATGAVLSVPRAAEAASLAPARGAVSSAPRLPKNFTVDDLYKLDARRQKQVQKLLDPTQLQQLLDDLELQREELEAQFDSTREVDEQRRDALKSKAGALAQARIDVRDLETELAEKQSQLQATASMIEIPGKQKREILEALRFEQDRIGKELGRAKKFRDDVQSELRLLARMSEEAQKRAAEAAQVRSQIQQNKESREAIAERAALVKALDNLPEWFNYLSAFFASSIATLLMYPLDTIKTRLVADEGAIKDASFVSQAESAEHGDDQCMNRSTKEDDSLDTQSPNGNNGVQPLLRWLYSGESLSVETTQWLQRALLSEDVVRSQMEMRPQEDNDVVRSQTEMRPQEDNDVVRSQAEMRSQEDRPSSKGWLSQDLASLYQGIWGTLLVKQGLPQAINLGIYEKVKSDLLFRRSANNVNPLVVYIIASAIAKIADSTIGTPAEGIKARAQAGVDAESEVDSFESFGKAFSNENSRDILFKGWLASLYRDVPYGAIQLAVFQAFQEYIIDSPSPIIYLDANSLSTEVLLSSIAAILGSGLTVPGDVVTTRILTQDAKQDPLGFADMTKQVWKEGGWRALLTGWRERVGYEAPSIGIFIACYCFIRRNFADLIYNGGVPIKEAVLDSLTREGTPFMD